MNNPATTTLSTLRIRADLRTKTLFDIAMAYLPSRSTITTVVTAKATRRFRDRARGGGEHVR